MYEFLSGFVHSPWMLLGLAGLAIPPIIHLLNRRRYDVVDWGAMQFLQISEVTRRRIFLEELLLMLLRMGLIGVLVFGLAGPFFTSSTMARMAPRISRDTVLIFDGSYSMGSLETKEKTPLDAAKEWALGYLDDLAPGDTIAVLQAKETVVSVLEATQDLHKAREAVRQLPPPAGACNWRSAMTRAHKVLEHSTRAEREIVLLTDNQRHGWADQESLFHWEQLRRELGYDRTPEAGAPARPRLWVVNLAQDRKADLPNWALAPLETDRRLIGVGDEVTFRTTLDIRNQPGDYAPPYRIRLEENGELVRHLSSPAAAQLQNGNGKVPFTFTHRFTKPGPRFISVRLQPDPPEGQRPANHQLRDVLPGDNDQDLAVEVIQPRPVLLVDNGEKGPSKVRGSYFIHRALVQEENPAPVVDAKVVSVDQFSPALLALPSMANNGHAPAPWRPRVVVLCDVRRLSDPQRHALSDFIASGGGVFVTLGEQAQEDRDFYNSLHDSGKGWLPAGLEKISGSESRPEEAMQPVPGSANHPALELFLEKTNREGEPPRFPQLAQARFPRWWKLQRPQKDASVVVATLRNATQEVPFLLEWINPNRTGHVLLASVPFDNSWGSSLPHQPAFIPLVHEIIVYLDSNRPLQLNLQPPQALRFPLGATNALDGYTLTAPGGKPRGMSEKSADDGAFQVEIDRPGKLTEQSFQELRDAAVPGPVLGKLAPLKDKVFDTREDLLKAAAEKISKNELEQFQGSLLAHTKPLPQGSMLRQDGPRQTGVWYLRTPENVVVPYVVRTKKTDESDLTPASEEDRRKVAALFPGMKYQTDRSEMAAVWISEGHRQEIWWWLLLGLIGLLCMEVWMTRRIVQQRG
jgi:hypothetical protein